MKYLFTLATMFSFLGVNKINPLSGNHALFYGGIVLVLIPTIYMIKKYFESKTIQFLIDSNIRKLERLIINNETDIEKIDEKMISTRGKLTGIGEVSESIKEVADSNLALWKDQIEIHRKIIYICRIRISSLSQNRNELDFLNHLVKQVKNEPDAGKKLARLEKLVKEIDSKVKSKFNEEVNRLILELKTDTRRGKIILLRERIEELGAQVG